MHVYVDESKQDQYLLIASVMLPADVSAARREVRSLVLAGQRRIHMNSEADPRRKTILARFADLGYTADVFRAGPSYKRDLDRREACLDQLVESLAATGQQTLLILESDRTLDHRDRRQLRSLTRALGCTDRLRYEHARAAQEPLLGVPDAIGWAFARGGVWRQRAAPLVNRVIDV